jgi:hypothetical protein
MLLNINSREFMKIIKGGQKSANFLPAVKYQYELSEDVNRSFATQQENEGNTKAVALWEDLRLLYKIKPLIVGFLVLYIICPRNCSTFIVF